MQTKFQEIIHELDIVQKKQRLKFFKDFRQHHLVNINAKNNDKNIVSNILSFLKRHRNELDFQIGNDFLMQVIATKLQTEFQLVAQDIKVDEQIVQKNQQKLVISFKSKEILKEVLLKCKSLKKIQKVEEEKEQLKQKCPEDEKKCDTESNYDQYFKEFVPCDKKKLKRSYVIKIHRAVSTPETYKLFFHFYQSVFNKCKTEQSFADWLCNSPVYDPLQQVEKNRIPHYNPLTIDDHRNSKYIEGVFPKYKGTYNMLHFIDGELIAVGVLDILDQFMISTQFFYNPRFREIGIGKIGALKEIQYIKRTNQLGLSKLKYYGMQNYSPMVPKFSYKVQFNNVDLLCLKTLKWVRFSQEIKERINKERDDLCDGFQQKSLYEMKAINDNFVNRVQEKGFFFQYSTLLSDFYLSQKLINGFKPLYFQMLKHEVISFSVQLGQNIADDFDFIYYHQFDPIVF